MSSAFLVSGCKTKYEKGFDAGYESTYQQGFNERYDAGFSAGQARGEAQGYADGYSSGQSSGYTSGYQNAFTDFASADYVSGYYAGDAQGYNQGYNAYYGIGASQGTTDGTNDGYNAGYNVGYNNGYNTGNYYGHADGYNYGYNNGFNIGANDGAYYGQQDGYNDGYADGYNYSYGQGYNDGYNYGLGYSNTSKNPLVALANQVNRDLINYAALPTMNTRDALESGRYVFSHSDSSSVDMEKLAALKEKFYLNAMSSQIQTRFSLSKESSDRIATIAHQFNKLGSSRTLTEKDASNFSRELIGFDMKEIETAVKKSAQGESSDLNNLLKAASDKVGTSPENFNKMISEIFY